jgi:hypothetical protein
MVYILFKQWLLATNLRDSQITRANLARQVTFFSKLAFGKCRRVQAKVLGKCQRVWQVHKSAWQMLVSLASPRKSAWRMSVSLANTCQAS